MCVHALRVRVSQWVIDTAAEDERRRQRRAELDTAREELANDLRDLKDSQVQGVLEAGADGSDSGNASDSGSEAEGA